MSPETFEVCRVEGRQGGEGRCARRSDRMIDDLESGRGLTQLAQYFLLVIS